MMRLGQIGPRLSAILWGAWLSIRNRQDERETGPSCGADVFGLDVPAMRFDYRAANRKSHAHAFLLRREEAVEQVGKVVGMDTGAAIFDDAGNLIVHDIRLN